MFRLLLILSTLSTAAYCVPAPQPAARAEASSPVPTLPTIDYGLGTITPILGKGSLGGIEVGGIGAHDLPGILEEHGTGDAQVGPGGVEVCLSQTFTIAVNRFNQKVATSPHYRFEGCCYVDVERESWTLL